MSLYGDLDKCAGKFYNPKRLLTFNKPWNFITGSRSVGKSTGWAIYCVLDFLHNGHKFIYVRRTKDEVSLTAPTFFGNAVPIIRNNTCYLIDEIRYTKQKFYIVYKHENEDGEIEEELVECGMSIPLSLEQKYKSANLSEYFNVIYDEFIAKNTSQYLGNSNTPDREYKAMLSLYQTIDRGIDKPYRNETKVFFLGNTATVYNPLFLSLGIAKYVTDNPGAKTINPKDKLWILERIETVDAIKDIENSYAYQLADEEERAYAYENKGTESFDTSFISEPNISVYDETFTLAGVDYGICHDADYNYYIGKPNYKASLKRYSLDVESHNGIDLKLIHRMMQHPLTMYLHEAYLSGRLYFNNVRTKQEFLKYLQFIPN